MIGGKDTDLTEHTETTEDGSTVTVEITESDSEEATTAGAAEVADADEVSAVADAADDEVSADVADDEVSAVADAADDADDADYDEEAKLLAPSVRKGGMSLSRLLAFIVLPVLVLGLAAAAGYLGWRDYQAQAADTARIESVQVAKESTIRLLSYQPDTVEQELTEARDLLTGDFQESYTQLTKDVVIPGAQQQRIAAVVNVPAVASVSASAKHAVALVFVNQTVTVGDSAPTSTNSSVRVSMDKVGDRWLVSEFEPV